LTEDPERSKTAPVHPENVLNIAMTLYSVGIVAALHDVAFARA
jgi:hypothetical protein